MANAWLESFVLDFLLASGSKKSEKREVVQMATVNNVLIITQNKIITHF